MVRAPLPNFLLVAAKRNVIQVRSLELSGHSQNRMAQCFVMDKWQMSSVRWITKPLQIGG
eukprot:4638645-Pyramimonas_sp.AAC.2